MTSSVTRFSYHTKSFSNQVSSNSDGVLFQLEKVIHVQNLVRKWEKNEKVGKKFLGYKMGQVFEIINRGKRDYKQGKSQGFQIGAKRLQIGAGTSNWERSISNQGSDCKSRQEGLQIGQGLQIGAEHIYCKPYG